MAFLKVQRHFREFGVVATFTKVLRALPAYAFNFYRWQFRSCRCCERLSVFVCNGPVAEFRSCVFCSANERYELLAMEIRARYGSAISEMEILELDPHSPLQRILCRARNYVRTFYEPSKPAGTRRADGTVCQDITALTFPNESFDLIVSSDVLEHVPSLENAFSESRRVLRPGKDHLFTVPPRSKTKKRAEFRCGEVVHLEPPEFHHDPLCPRGILAFWDVGPDLGDLFGSETLRFSIVRGPSGPDRRIVWRAHREPSSR